MLNDDSQFDFHFPERACFFLAAVCCRCYHALSDDIVEEEDELVESARADEARFRAFRCFFLIEAFSAQQKV